MKTSLILACVLMLCGCSRKTEAPAQVVRGPVLPPAPQKQTEEPTVIGKWVVVYPEATNHWTLCETNGVITGESISVNSNRTSTVVLRGVRVHSKIEIYYIQQKPIKPGAVTMNRSEWYYHGELDGDAIKGSYDFKDGITFQGEEATTPFEATRLWIATRE